MEGQWKRFDLETQGTVSLALDQKKLQLGLSRFAHPPAACDSDIFYYVAT